MITEEHQAVVRYFASGSDALMSYIQQDDGQVLFTVQPAAKRHPLALVRLMKRERERLRGCHFILDHAGDPCMLRIAKMLGVYVPHHRPCEVSL